MSLEALLEVEAIAMLQDKEAMVLEQNLEEGVMLLEEMEVEHGTGYLVAEAHLVTAIVVVEVVMKTAKAMVV